MAYLERAQRNTSIRLSELRQNEAVTVNFVREDRAGDPVSCRLRDIGFVQGEPVHVVARAPFGGDPMVVQVGFTRFALRRSEAARVIVSQDFSANRG